MKTIQWCIPACALLCAALLLPAAGMGAQRKVEYGGYAESIGQFYWKRPNPGDAYAIGETRAQLWSRISFGDKLSWRAAYEFRLDTHRDVARTDWSDVSQRGLRRPAGAVAEFYCDLHLGRIDLRVGQQQIRWGRADGFNPTDNLIPYDYLDTFSDQRLPVTALKADVYAGKSKLEAAWIPFFTPTRLPLPGQRWFPALSAAGGITPVEGSRLFPARTFGNGQWAVRWNQWLPRGEFSVSYFDGFDDLPFFTVGSPGLRPEATQVFVPLNRLYFRTRVAGADFATELGPVGIRGEAAYFDNTDPANRDHLLYVVGIDRTWGDWFAVVQYSDRYVSAPVSPTAVFPELAFRSTALYRIERTIGPSSSFEVKGAVRLRDGDVVVQPAYSIGLSNNWRLKIGATVFGGSPSAYLGQFRDNANIVLSLRRSF